MSNISMETVEKPTPPAQQGQPDINSVEVRDEKYCIKSDGFISSFGAKARSF